MLFARNRGWRLPSVTEELRSSPRCFDLLRPSLHRQSAHSSLVLHPCSICSSRTVLTSEWVTAPFTSRIVRVTARSHFGITAFQATTTRRLAPSPRHGKRSDYSSD